MWVEVNEIGLNRENKEHLIPRIINTDNIKVISDSGEYIKFIDNDDMTIAEDSAKKLKELLIGK